MQNPYARFLVDVVVATMIFAVVAAFALAIDIFGDYLAAQNYSKVLLGALSVSEWLVLATDAALFAIFILRSSYSFAAALWKGERNGSN
jgi:hypothetical protein